MKWKFLAEKIFGFTRHTHHICSNSSARSHSNALCDIGSALSVFSRHFIKKGPQTYILHRNVFFSPIMIIRSYSQNVCNKCAHKQILSRVTRLSPLRNFTLSSKFAGPKAGGSRSKNQTVIPRTSEIKRLLSLSRPEKWRILGM